MGKLDETQLPNQQQEGADGSFFCQRCSMGFSRIFTQFSFKCVFVLLLSFALFFSTLFLILPHIHYNHSSFDANSWIKKTAVVQACFELEKPVSELIPEIARLEYDINAEIGVNHTKVAVLSMHQRGASNWTYVVFGYLPVPVNGPADAVSLAVLKLSLVDLFLQQINLTLTNSTFGQTSSFEILEFPGGVTIIPQQPFWPNGQILFNFILNNSMSDVNKNIVQLSGQLKLFLHLMPDENVYVQLTNKNGSTRDPPITVEASITSGSGSLSPERLKQLAQNITRSLPGKNLGLNNTVFGKVKQVSLSSYLNHTIDTSAPSPSPSPMQDDYPGRSPSPAPSLMQDDYPGPSPTPYASPSPSYSPSPSTSFPYPPDSRLPPSPESEPPSLGSPTPTAGHCGTQRPPSPSQAPRPPDLLSPSPSRAPRPPDLPPPPSSPPPTDSLTSHISPAPSPLLNRTRHKASEYFPFTSMAPSQLSFHKKSWWFFFIGLLAFHLSRLDPLMWC